MVKVTLGLGPFHLASSRKSDWLSLCQTDYAESRLSGTHNIIHNDNGIPKETRAKQVALA